MGDETVMLTIGDWTFVEVPHPETPPMMYVHHNCDEMEVMGGNITQCNKCKMLVPDEITVQMVLDRISAPDGADGVLFDGFPRTIEQAEALDKAFEPRGQAIDKVIYIKVPEEELLRRLGGRWICRNCQTPYHEVDSMPKVAGKCDRCGGELYQRDDDKVETVKTSL